MEFVNIKLNNDFKGLKANETYSAEKNNDKYTVWANGEQVTGVTEEMLVKEEEEQPKEKSQPKPKVKVKPQEKVEEAIVETSKKRKKISSPQATIIFIGLLFFLLLFVRSCFNTSVKKDPSDNIEIESKSTPVIKTVKQEDNVDLLSYYLTELIQNSRLEFEANGIPKSVIAKIDYRHPAIKNAARQKLIEAVSELKMNTRINMVVLDTFDVNLYNSNESYRININSKIISDDK